MDSPPAIEEPFEEETLFERFFGLSEMFPEPVRNVVSKSLNTTTGCAKWIFSATKTVAWLTVSTAAILILPISLETERADYEEKMKQQERNILLGPDTQIS